VAFKNTPNGQLHYADTAGCTTCCAKGTGSSLPSHCLVFQHVAACCISYLLTRLRVIAVPPPGPDPFEVFTSDNVWLPGKSVATVCHRLRREVTSSISSPSDGVLDTHILSEFMFYTRGLCTDDLVQRLWCQINSVTVTVTLSSPSSKVVGLRYAWTDYPQCVLYDGPTFLPAPPLLTLQSSVADAELERMQETGQMDFAFAGPVLIYDV